jgi:hypothetical protein
MKKRTFSMESFANYSREYIHQMRGVNMRKRVERLAKRYNITPIPSRPEGVWTLYKLLDADGKCLYVGSTCFLSKRLQGHRSRQYWWGEVDSVSIVELPPNSTKQSALIDEYMEIRASRPAYNIVGNNYDD